MYKCVFVFVCILIHVHMYTNIYTHMCVHTYKFKLKMSCQQKKRHLDSLSTGALASNLTPTFFCTLQTDLLDLHIETSAPATQ